MASQNMPNTYTSTTTTTTKVIITPRFDPSYIRTLPGILKIVEMVLDIIGFICVMVSGIYSSRTNWFSFVSMTGFWVTGVLLFFYLFHLIEKTYFLPWFLMEFVYCGTWTLFYLIAAAFVASWASYTESYGAAAFFGFSAMLVYGFDAFLKFKGWRNKDLAQGDRETTSSPGTAPTAY